MYVLYAAASGAVVGERFERSGPDIGGDLVKRHRRIHDQRVAHSRPQTVCALGRKQELNGAIDDGLLTAAYYPDCDGDGHGVMTGNEADIATTKGRG